MSKLFVELGRRGYPIHIGPGLFGRDGPLSIATSGRDLMIVSNETVAPLYLAAVTHATAGARRTENIILPDGESYKTLVVLDRVFSALLQKRFGRDAVLLALGGGVVGDLVGFAAASFQRGIDFVQVPTTLLAQVDSSVGGKTAVNHALGKNMIGAFHQPISVVADTTTLDTLPDRELSAGMAEVVKYGLVCDAAFFLWLEDNAERLLARDREALTYAIQRSCEIKAQVVAVDERETGNRALLNLGHTFGHAIENAMGYGVWLHGEAVAAGMAMAADLSRRLGWLTNEDVERTETLLKRLALPIRGPHELGPETLRDLMMVDKKVAAGKNRLVLLRSIGDALLSENFDESNLFTTLTECRSTA
jgi:3-dehydroquinate synthase